MGNYCEQPQAQVEQILALNQGIVEWINLIIFSVAGVVCTTTTYALFKKGPCREVPLFVIAQMVLLNIFWVDNISYFVGKVLSPY